MFSAAADCRADTLLHALGESMNKEYREMRQLGPAPTPSQISEVRRDVYNPFIARAIGEGAQMWRSERHKVDEMLMELRAALFPQIYKGKGGKIGVNIDGKGGAANGAGPGPGAGGGAMPSSVQNRPAAAAQAGSDGAKDVGFTKGGKAKEKPVKVDDDGIIQDR